MSEYDNMDYLDIISRKDIYTLCEYYKKSFEFTDTFDNLKTVLISKPYLSLINDVCRILTINPVYKRTIGLLCLIKYKPMDFYSSFNYNNYNNYVKSNAGLQSELDDTLSELDDTLSELDDTISELDDTLSELDDTISELEVYFYIVYNSTQSIIKLLSLFIEINKELDMLKTTDNINTTLKYDKIKVNKLYSLLKSHMNKYITYFNLWKEEDKKTEITRLIQSYWEIEITKKQVNESNKYSPQQKTESVNELTCNQQQLKGYLKQIGGDEALNDLSLSIPVVIDDSLLNHIRNNLELVYWEDIEKDVLNNDYTKLKSILEDFKTTLLKINKNTDFTRDVNDVLDVDFFINRLENNAVDLYEGLQFNHIFNKWLLMLDAPIHDELNKGIKLNIDSQLQEITMLITNSKSNNDGDSVSRTDKLKCICKCLSVLINVYYTKFNGILEVKNEILNSIED